ncbi:MAG: DmsE family decaheme c-type cytochrome [Acidobacteria bacterium]|nr:DmsE family decaheme c-type cytochrome [Acidobacteriota bacterium]MBI3278388.1 DmsE family decaheme c-type cytochrome [Acidobacteriota bacterium]
MAALFVLALAAWGQTGPLTTPANPAQPQYVGSSVCRGCHPNVWVNFYKNPHYKLLASGDEPPERAGCEGCHGPGKAHVEARGGKATIRAFSVMTPKQVLDSCLACHSRDFPRANIRRSEHTLNNVVCANCHSIHRAATPKFLLAKVQREVCYGCHTSVRAQFSMPFKHRVNEGLMQCSDCHNPHGAPSPAWRTGLRPRMTSQALANEEACMKCHVDKRGPFLFEHAAVRADGCEVCHQPHGSPNPRLLRRPVVFTVCLECHNGAGNFGREGDGITVQSPSHNMADPRFHNCTTCHVRIHGSNADPRFLR